MPCPATTINKRSYFDIDISATDVAAPAQTIIPSTSPYLQDLEREIVPNLNLGAESCNLCKEKIRVFEADTPEMESGISAEITDSDIHSHSCKPSSLEKITVLECQKLETLKSGSVSKTENPLDSVSFLSSCLNSSKDTKLTNGRGDLGPITPFPDSETMEISSASDQTENLEMLSGCQTPTESIFDPFAPGPEDLDEEDSFLELLCKSFLELIVLNQLKEISNEDSVEEDNPSEGLTTPTSIPFLTGIAETCPAAPMRPILKSRRLDKSICRKLEFGTDLNCDKEFT